MAGIASTPAAGILLVAPPVLEEPNFRRTVIVLCEHGAEGSFGLILNRPLPIDIGQAADELGGKEMISLGGPVQPNTLHFLHRHGDLLTDAIPVIDGVHWGGDFEAMKALLREGHATRLNLRFFLGYAGWAPGQLEDEIVQGGWFLARADNDTIFASEPDRLWRDVLRRMGGDYAVLANFPDDPRMN